MSSHQHHKAGVVNIERVIGLEKQWIPLFVNFHLSGVGGFLLRTFIHGIVLKILWTWFVSDVFNLPRLTIAGSAGIYLLYAFIKHDYSIKRIHNHVVLEAGEEADVEGRRLITLYRDMIIRSAAALTAGAILHYVIFPVI